MNQNTSFWNFKDKKVYTSVGQKWADFLFGVLAPIFVRYATTSDIFLFLQGMVPVSLLISLLEIALVIYLFNRRSFISYGIIASVIVLRIITVLFITTLFGRMYF